jgi:hypothetical protein
MAGIAARLPATSQFVAAVDVKEVLSPQAIDILRQMKMASAASWNQRGCLGARSIYFFAPHKAS